MLSLLYHPRHRFPHCSPDPGKIPGPAQTAHRHPISSCQNRPGHPVCSVYLYCLWKLSPASCQYYHSCQGSKNISFLHNLYSFLILHLPVCMFKDNITFLQYFVNIFERGHFFSQTVTPDFAFLPHIIPWVVHTRIPMQMPETSAQRISKNLLSFLSEVGKSQTFRRLILFFLAEAYHDQNHDR